MNVLDILAEDGELLHSESVNFIEARKETGVGDSEEDLIKTFEIQIFITIEDQDNPTENIKSDIFDRLSFTSSRRTNKTAAVSYSECLCDWQEAFFGYTGLD